MRRSVTCYGLNVVLTLLAMETFVNHGATYGFGGEERWICRSGWYLNRRGQKPLIRKTFYQLIKQMETMWH